MGSVTVKLPQGFSSNIPWAYVGTCYSLIISQDSLPVKASIICSFAVI